MKIIADENIPFAQELFSHLGDVTLKPGRNLERTDVKDADFLLVRSVTKVNETLLAGSNVQFVGTCTIGTDHIDTQYLARSNISYSSAPGCNANSVVQYVICALAYLNRLKRDQKVGIIGCGNVGGRVYRALKSLGFDCVCIDPHLTSDIIPDLAEFNAIYDCDIICMHTPRIRDGQYPTESLLGASDFIKMKPGAVLLNAGRGECINNIELLDYLKCHNDLTVVLDVWAGEPNINTHLFKYVAIGSPHIAGYSFEGKVNGSMMIFEALSAHLDKPQEWVDSILHSLRETHFGPREQLVFSSLNELVANTYDIRLDHDALASVLPGLPKSFDVLRKQYRKRREFAHYSASGDSFLKDSHSFSLDSAKILGF